MKKYKARITPKGGGYQTEIIVQANSSTDARRIIEMQYGAVTIAMLSEVK